MKKIIIGIIIGIIVASAWHGFAASTDISAEPLWNRAFISATDSMRAIGV